MPRAGGPLKTRTDFDETVEKDLNSDPAKRTVWHIYNEKSEKEDEAFLKGINEAMDVLLIFVSIIQFKRGQILRSVGWFVFCNGSCLSPVYTSIARK